MTSSASSRSPTPTPEAKLPLCVFAIGEYPSFKVLQKNLQELGVNSVFVTSDSDMAFYTDLPETFAVFVDPRRYPKSLHHFHASRQTRKAFWIVATVKSASRKQFQFYSLGISDVLTVPIHPVTFRNKAQLFLIRFVKNFGFPDDITLHPDIIRAATVERSENSSSSTSTGNGGPEGNLITIKGYKTDTTGSHSTFSSSFKEEAAPKNIVSPWNTRSENPYESPLITGKFGNRFVEPSKTRFFKKVSEHLKPVVRDFESISDPVVKKGILGEIKNTTPKGVIWTPRQERVENCTVHTLGSHKFQFKLLSGASGYELYEHLKSKSSNGFFGSVYLKRMRMFFSMSLSSSTPEKNSIILDIPDDLFQIQRRRFFRLYLNNTNSMNMQMAPKKYPESEVQVLDISAGGARLRIDFEMYQKLKQYEIIPKVVFEICGRQVETAAALRWKKTRHSVDNQIGIQFIDLDPSIEDGINLFVMEENYSYLTKHVDASP